MAESSPQGRSSDEELVQRAREGDPRAMDGLVSRHHASVYRTALSILRDEEAAADVTQDAFLRAFRGLGGFRGDASFRTWLLSIASNQAKGFLRKASRRREQSLESTVAVASGAASPETRLIQEEAVGQVRRVLEKLPEKQRRAVTLRIFEGLSFREVGELIGSSEGAARVNYHHGIRRLREELG